MVSGRPLGRAFLTGWTALAATTACAAADDGTFLLFTDIHYDPYFGNSTYGFGACNAPGSLAQFGCDSPIDLVRAAFQSAAQSFPDPDFILICGDSVRHDGYMMPNPHQDIGMVLDTVRNLTREFWPSAGVVHSSLSDPHLRVLQAIGNNDVVLDYVLNVDGTPGQNPQLRLFATEWASELNASQYDSLVQGGYYEREMVAGLRVLSINTVIYSRKHCNAGPYPSCIANTTDDPDPADPFGQFAWLNTRLNAAANDGAAVYIMGHIPPTLESHGDRGPYWKDMYVASFLNLVTRHRAVLQGLLFGHLHTDEWRAGGALNAVGLPLLISSSITPIYDNNPSYKAVTYNRDTKALLDYRTFSTNIMSTGGGFDTQLPWPIRFTMSSLTGSTGLTLDTMHAVARQLESNDTVFDGFYQTDYKAGVHQPPCNATCRHAWSCLLSTFTPNEYATCLASPGNGASDNTRSATVVAGVVSVMVLLTVVLTVTQWYRGWPACRGRRSVRYHQLEVEHGVDGDTMELEDLLVAEGMADAPPTSIGVNTDYEGHDDADDIDDSVFLDSALSSSA